MSTSAERILILMSMLEDLKKMKDELKEKKEEPEEEEEEKKECSYGYHFMPFESALAILKSSWKDLGSASEVLGITCTDWPDDELLYIDGEDEEGIIHRGYAVAGEVYPCKGSEDDDYYLSSDDIIYGKWRVVYRP